ncbi:hypothetical protein D915_002852 [Fasciola hepatica]|uniref:ETS domain-containing protein n=1 Tax=Fasciola hepatica TaxID=6192 RepID=A0A4E0REK7_FASHE|nr:hypothetical protein D915_002852 [Fasciola hepatica]
MRAPRLKATSSHRKPCKRFISEQLHMKAIIKLLKATWRHPENDLVRDSTFCTSCVDHLLRSDDRNQFTEPFGPITGEELFQQFTELKATYKFENLSGEIGPEIRNLDSCDVPHFNRMIGRRSKQARFTSTETSSTSSSYPTSSSSSPPSSLSSSSLLQPSKKSEQWILWKFILCLLEMPSQSKFISWIDQDAGTFKFAKKSGSTRVAKLWGYAKGNSAMNYDIMTRSFRDYYKNILNHSPKRLVYGFNWSISEVAEFRKSLSDPLNVEYYKNVSNLVKEFDRLKGGIYKTD